MGNLYRWLALSVLCGRSLAFLPRPPPTAQGRTAAAAAGSWCPRATLAPNGPDAAERVALFDDGIYADIASAYEKLDKRIKEGPRSLTAADLLELEAELTRIGDEMRQNRHKKPPRTASQSSSSSESRAVPAASPPTPAAAAATASPPTPVRQARGTDTAAEHEAPTGFDGGYGVAQGTTNTYAIEGMDEMTPAEYQVAIQESISARQRARRAAAGAVGAQAAQNYLNNL